jgi:hypothetical protein
MRRSKVSTNKPRRDPALGSKRHYSHIDPDWTDEEINAWAKRFVDVVLGDATETPRIRA